MVTMSPYADTLDTIATMEKRPFINTVERLASVVKEARKSLDLTQAQLAEKADVSRQFVIEIEAGHPRAEVGKVFALLAALGLSPQAIPVLPKWAFDETGALRTDIEVADPDNDEGTEDGAFF